MPADRSAPARGARRWLVIGSSGAGKSTFARRLSDRLSLPAVHLDRHFWSTGWTPTPDGEWERAVETLASADAWVMDGNYSRTLHLRLPRAEAVVLLDRNPLLCLARVLRRARSRAPRADIPDDCPDRLPDRQFVWWILSYRWRSRPKVLRLLADYPEIPLFTLRSEREVERFFAELDVTPMEDGGTFREG